MFNIKIVTLFYIFIHQVTQPRYTQKSSIYALVTPFTPIRHTLFENLYMYNIYTYSYKFISIFQAV